MEYRVRTDDLHALPRPSQPFQFNAGLFDARVARLYDLVRVVFMPAEGRDEREESV